MSWLWFVLSAAVWLVVVASAALCPFLVATVIVELRELRQIVESKRACDCRRPPLPLPLPRHRFGELLDD